jgi:ABC-type siderophore export system fused ATPase/permease subunit
MMKKLVLATVAATVLAFGSIALAQFEAHPHLRAAHDKIDEAIAELRTANDGKKEYGGHRDRAEALLVQAQGEIKAAAEFANTHHN